jgi:hypothetical protein
MLIIGLDEVEFEPFYFIKNIDDISVTPSNSTVVFEYSKDNLELIRHCRKNSVSFALICDELKDTLFANANDANFIICDKTIVKDAQKFADEYMFDAKVLLYSSNEDDLLWCANEGVDGILLKML